jgi:hypothetical protein
MTGLDLAVNGSGFGLRIGFCLVQQPLMWVEWLVFSGLLGLPIGFDFCCLCVS